MVALLLLLLVSPLEVAAELSSYILASQQAAPSVHTPVTACVMSHNNPGILQRSPRSPATNYVPADDDSVEMGNPVYGTSTLAHQVCHSLLSTEKATVLITFQVLSFTFSQYSTYVLEKRIL